VSKVPLTRTVERGRVVRDHPALALQGGAGPRNLCILPERDFFIDNLLVRIHFIIVMIRWNGLAPWEHPATNSHSKLLYTSHDK